jgi:hypothetical protein
MGGTARSVSQACAHPMKIDFPLAPPRISKEIFWVHLRDWLQAERRWHHGARLIGSKSWTGGRDRGLNL